MICALFLLTSKFTTFRPLKTLPFWDPVWAFFYPNLKEARCFTACNEKMLKKDTSVIRLECLLLLVDSISLVAISSWRRLWQSGLPEISIRLISCFIHRWKNTNNVCSSASSSNLLFWYCFSLNAFSKSRSMSWQVSKSRSGENNINKQESCETTTNK